MRPCAETRGHRLSTWLHLLIEETLSLCRQLRPGPTLTSESIQHMQQSAQHMAQDPLEGLTPMDLFDEILIMLHSANEIHRHLR